MTRRFDVALLALAVACTPAPPRAATTTARPAASVSAAATPRDAPAASAAPQAPEDATIARLREQARGLLPLVSSALAAGFLHSAEFLQPEAMRSVHHDAERTRFYTAREFAALPPEKRGSLVEKKGATDLYYETNYGSPLAYVRAMDIAGEAGLSDVRGMRVLDFGYGSIGQLRLLARLGADVVGVDVDPFLPVLYSEPGDTGRYPPGAADAGTVSLVHGRFPGDATVAASVGRGFALIVSKNTLKNGYFHPEGPVSERQRFDLGVSDADFVRALHDALVPGGLVVIYNVSPPPAGPGEKYRPHADGRSPFPRKVWERAGFEVLAFDRDDGPSMRRIAGVLGWAEEMNVVLETGVFAMFTLARRPAEVR